MTPILSLPQSGADAESIKALQAGDEVAMSEWCDLLEIEPEFSHERFLRAFGMHGHPSLIPFLDTVAWKVREWEGFVSHVAGGAGRLEIVSVLAPRSLSAASQALEHSAAGSYPQHRAVVEHLVPLLASAAPDRLLMPLRNALLTFGRPLEEGNRQVSYEIVSLLLSHVSLSRLLRYAILEDMHADTKRVLDPLVRFLDRASNDPAFVATQMSMPVMEDREFRAQAAEVAPEVLSWLDALHLDSATPAQAPLARARF